MVWRFWWRSPHPPPSEAPDHRRGKTIPGHYSCPPIVPLLLTVGPSRLPVANRARQPGPFLEIRSLLLPQAALHGFPRKRLAPSATGGASPLSPEGKASVQYNCRGYNGHQGSALKRGNRGNCHPLAGAAVQGNDTNGTRLPIIGNKGVLRTIGSKSTFAYFSLTRKVGRRRHNTYQYTVGYRQKRTPPRQRDKKPPPSPEGKKRTNSLRQKTTK